MSKPQADLLGHLWPARWPRPSGDAVAVAATVGAVTLGVAVIEAALIPGVLIGGAVVLAPRLLPKRWGAKAAPARSGARKTGTAARKPAAAAIVIPQKLALTQSAAKTITFRAIVTALDFTTNYIVLGNFTTAAGLSGFSLVVAPVFYFIHETGWNYYGSEITPEKGYRVNLPFAANADGTARGFTVSRAVAKTVTFRTIATVMDFTVTYIVVGDALTAAGLSAFGFVLGPFVYLGHEKAWEFYNARKTSAPALAAAPALAGA